MLVYIDAVGAGMLGAVALPVVGVGVGVAQIVRGVVNTPEAIREQQKGKSWDQVQSYRLVRNTIFSSK